VFVLALSGVLAAPAAARVHHNDAWARQEFARAERMREALNGRPANQRTRHEYQRAIDAYRRVYFGSPAASKADPSVVATAELMVEMGRRFGDDKILREAVEEYHFLRKEYPGSKYRFDALFTIGEIYKDDLNDPEQARKTFEDFLHRYPRNRLVDDARAAVKELDDAAKEKERTARKSRGNRGVKESAGNLPASNSSAGNANDASNGTPNGAPESGNAARRSDLPRVTGVRHWSTPDYTRVAIDIEQEVKFNSLRIANPDRIFFDLLDTKLASTLVGKTFDVDDGFLKKIRVAEFKPGQTRVVLEVDDLSSYDAFLLPDPYRLIIDVHGKQSRASELAKTHGPATSGLSVAAGKSSVFAPASDTSASADKEEDASDVVPEQHGKVKSEKEHAIAEEVEPENGDADDGPQTTTSGARGVVRTTVAVKGTDRKIPKTIVGPDDDSLSKKGKARRKQGSVVTADDSTTSNSARKHSTHLVKDQASGDTADAADMETREARPTALGDRSLTRALGLKIGKIVIDAGHGGHDTGTIGPNGLQEKDLVLDVAKRLGRLLETRLGADVVYTRRDDTFVPLETRTAIANRERADLFISIHANSSRDEGARGVETYYLNFTSSPEALEVAARENAVSEKSIHELQDLVKKIALKEKIDESREFASDIQDSLYGGLSLSNVGIRNRGVKKAPFIVLIGANMPSILAEISFVSNPTDERKLETSEHRQRIAESLYRGVARYAGGLSGVKVASKVEKTEGQ
jgi:N-acetylmuramoyl-L-alanine amidase